MGFNTACIILNDTLHYLAKDPDAGAEIERAVLTSWDKRHVLSGQCRHGFQALKSVHADTMQIVAVGGNTIRCLGYGSYNDTDEQLLRKLADALGFRIVRKNAQARGETP
jgi:hypothetical protein